jgi:hypothetical protein
VGEAAPCGAQRRGVPSFSLSQHFHFQIYPNFYFSDTTPFRFTFSVFTIHIPHKNIHPLKKSPLTQERNIYTVTLSWEIHIRAAMQTRIAGPQSPFRSLFTQEGLISFSDSTFTLFTRRHFSHFQIPPNFYFSDTIPFRLRFQNFRFTISDS